MAKKRYANTAARRKTVAGVGAANRLGSRTPLVPTVTDNATTSVTITFNEQVVIHDVPAYTGGADSITCTAAEQTSPGEVVLTFNHTATGLTVPFEDPAIRNMAGGYVQPGTYTFPG